MGSALAWGHTALRLTHRRGVKLRLGYTSTPALAPGFALTCTPSSRQREAEFVKSPKRVILAKPHG